MWTIEMHNGVQIRIDLQREPRDQKTVSKAEEVEV